MFDYSEFKCGFLSRLQIEKKTAEFRQKYWPENTLPIDMEKIIGKKLKLDIIPSHHIKKLTKTDAYLQSDLTAIVVDFEQYMDDENRYANRLRFSFAHEIGHYILHRNIYSKLHLDSFEDYCFFIDHFPEDVYDDFEWQANEFAGSLLVPRERLIQEIQKIYEMIIQENMVEYLEKYPNDILARVSKKLRKPFGVSTEAIELRVEKEKLWPPTSENLA